MRDKRGEITDESITIDLDSVSSSRTQEGKHQRGRVERLKGKKNHGEWQLSTVEGLFEGGRKTNPSLPDCRLASKGSLGTSSVW